MSESTPRPWRMSNSHGLCIHADKVLVAEFTTGPRAIYWIGKRADAELIVRCVNTYDGLVEVIKALIEEHRLFWLSPHWVCPFCGFRSLDVTNFLHKEDCPILLARNAIANAEE